MARAAAAFGAGRKGFGDNLAIDGVRALLLAVHFAIIAYVCLGWMIPSRGLLFFYALLLPAMMLQWLLNGGASIINNIENLVRFGRWSDPRNPLEGALFKTLLHAAGIRASQAQIATVLCFAMLIFWIAAVCNMILIVPEPV
jgi:hypothetical protein